jgi:hypothetical protein
MRDSRRIIRGPRLVLAGARVACFAVTPIALAQPTDFTPRPSSAGFEAATPEAVEASAAALVAAPEASADPNRLLRVPLSAVGREARRGGQVPWAVLVMAAGLLIVLAGAVSLHRRLYRSADEPAPGQAFLGHARRIGLSWSEVWLLVRIARGARLPTPLTLLIAAGPLYHHGRQFAAGLSMSRRERVHRRISAIHRKAFPQVAQITQIDPEPDAAASLSSASSLRPNSLHLAAVD